MFLRKNRTNDAEVHKNIYGQFLLSSLFEWRKTRGGIRAGVKRTDKVSCLAACRLYCPLQRRDKALAVKSKVCTQAGKRLLSSMFMNTFSHHPADTIKGDRKIIKASNNSMQSV